MTEISRLHIPDPRARPGEAPDFTDLSFPAAGSVYRPPVDARARDIQPFAFGMVRVLDDDDTAVGAWNPDIDPGELKAGVRHMLTTRLFDERMQTVHRQGKISFYIRSTGEEAVAVAAAMAMASTDMCFPSYRNQGLHVTRGMSLVDLMSQCLSNTRDMCKGRQMPIMYHWKKGNIGSISGNLAAQVPHAVGWAMAAALKGDDDVAATWLGEGATAEPDFHHGLVFASVYRAPVVINVVNNQWAISTPQSFAGGEHTSFAARALGFDIPGIRVDGNDFLAVYAATRWAVERARQGFGATLLEHVTYRVGAHSTSDDPTRYRPADEPSAWPLGDPLVRLQKHLEKIGHGSEAEFAALEQELREHVAASWREATRYGTMTEAPFLDREAMFEDVFETVPPHLDKQRTKLRALIAKQDG